MYNATITFNNFIVTCKVEPDPQDSNTTFNGTALGLSSRQFTINFSGNLTSADLNKTVTFIYYLGPECSINFFDSNGSLIDGFVSTTSCDFIENSGGVGTFS